MNRMCITGCFLTAFALAAMLLGLNCAGCSGMDAGGMKKAIYGAQAGVNTVAKAKLVLLNEECQKAADECRAKKVERLKCATWNTCDAKRVEWEATVQGVEDGLLKLNAQLGGAK